MNRRLLIKLLPGFLAIAGLLAWYPVRTQFLRITILAVGTAIFTTLLLLAWKRRPIRFALITLAALPALWLVLPGRPADPAALRAAYVQSLGRYQGTRYVWGGESWRGVDCSGFLRAALIDAHLRESFRTLNPRLARHAAALWWHDASARAMAEGYRGIARPLAPASPLRDLSVQNLLPGDFAVTADGSHVLAYLGGNDRRQWIEADPYELRVLTFSMDGTGPWCAARGAPCRWTCLDPTP